MRFVNHTKMPDDLLKEIIRFACPAGVSGFDITFKNSASGYKGRAYTQGSHYHGQSMLRKGAKSKGGKWQSSIPYVVIGCSKLRAERKWTRPYKFVEHGAYLGNVVFSNVEAIVDLVAHELRHLWQARVKRGYRVWGARGQFSERDADAYALRIVRAWRRR